MFCGSELFPEMQFKPLGPRWDNYKKKKTVSCWDWPQPSIRAIWKAVSFVVKDNNFCELLFKENL